MTPTEWSLVLASAATVAAALSALVALLTLARTVAWQVPTVEFLREYGEHTPRRYKLMVSNPTRRLLVLDYVGVVSPSADEVRIQPSQLDLHGTVERAYDEIELPSKRKKPVFLPVKPGETADLEIDFGTQEDFEVEFRLYWSKSLRGIERWCVPQDLKLDSDEVKSRTRLRQYLRKYGGPDPTKSRP